MNIFINPTTEFSGVLEIPSDKSLTHRAIFLSALSDGVSTIENPLMAEDCLSTAACLEALGCRIEKNGTTWRVHGVGLWGFKPPASPLNCGNSGTTMRLISGILAAQDFPVVLMGDASLSSRPMRRVADPLESMGAKIGLRENKFAPIRIQGTTALKPISWKSPVASAQVKSCVLLAGLHAKGETSFSEPSLSRDHTERMLKACGVAVRQKGTEVFVHGPAKLKAQAWSIPGDISSAAFFLCGALLVEKAQVTLKKVNLNPTRTGILDVLKKAGALFSVDHLREMGGEPVGDLRIESTKNIGSFNIDESIVPRLIDEIPILAVVATQAKGISIFKGLSELRIKETDRIKAIAENLNRMGAKVKEISDGLEIHGPTPLQGGRVKSFGDHRIAMSMAIAGLIAEGQTQIEESECVAISFPEFWSMLGKLGGQLN